MAEVTYTFQVEGMHCGSCGMLIDEVLADLDGVTGSQTSVRTGVTTVRADAGRCTPEQVVAAISGAGYQARPAD